MIIKLTFDEFNYLKNNKVLPEKLQQILNSFKSHIGHRKVHLDIADDLIDDFRDCFEEQKLLEGFDENYNLNKDGKILDSLIDKFYIG